MNILALLDRPIAFHRAFIPLGGVKVALFLSQAVYWTLRLPKDRDGWFYKTAAAWEDETGLSDNEQATVRKKLVESGILTEELRGMPATLWFRINTDALAEALSKNPCKSQFPETQETSFPKPGEPVSRKVGNKFPGKQESSNSTKITSETTSQSTTPPLPPKEGGGGETDAWSVINALKFRLCLLHGRNTQEFWPNDDEHLLVDVARRPDVMTELESIERLYTTADRSKLPRSIRMLLTRWVETYERSKNIKAERPQPQPQVASRNVGTYNEHFKNDYSRLMYRAKLDGGSTAGKP